MSQKQNQSNKDALQSICKGNPIEKFNLFQRNYEKQQNIQAEQIIQNSAVLELLLIREQEHSDWKEKGFRDKKSLEIRKREKDKSKHMRNILSKQTKQKEVQEAWHRNSLHNKFSSAGDYHQQKYAWQQNHNMPNHSKRKLQQSDYLPIYCSQMPNDLKKNTFHMNQTNYWSKHRRNEKISQLSSKERSNNFRSFYQRPSNNSIDLTQNMLISNFRASSQLNFSQNSSPLQCDQNYPGQTSPKPRQIKILANKSLTVRQMLHRISSNQKIQIRQTPHTTRKLLHPNRQPFDPGHKSVRGQHYRKFTPFREEEQKQMTGVLKIYEDHQKSNSEIGEGFEGPSADQIAYCGTKPTYCSWVQRNKEKLKRRKNKHPLTVRPLRMIN